MSTDFVKPQNFLSLSLLINDTHSGGGNVTFEKLKQVDKCFFKWS